MTEASLAVKSGRKPANMIPINSTIEESEYLSMDPEGGWITDSGEGIAKKSYYTKRHSDPIFHMRERLKNHVERVETIVKEAGGTVEDGKGIFDKTDWNDEIIRAFLYEAEEYLAGTGRTLDDFMNGE